MKKVFLLSLVSLIFCPLSIQAQGVLAKKLSVGQNFFEKPTPQAQEWTGVSESMVVLLPQNIATPSLTSPTVNQLQVKAIHNEKWLAIRVEWADPTKSHQVSTDMATDAVAIQFPLKGGDQTSPFMGTKEAPVAIMQWKALWQHDIEKGYQKVTDIYPNTYNETYQFGIHAARDVGNPVANNQRKTAAEEYVAGGFGSLTIQAHQDAFASGEWKDGKWTVVFSRPLKSKDENDPQLKVKEKTSFSFAVWEGGQKNVGGRKNYAMWTPLLLE